jgi:hypothetical protein
MKFAPLNLTPEEIIEYTPEWRGERFADGRPRVADDIVERMRRVSVTQAWGLLRNEGYNWQYEGDWQCTHPGGTLVGRAVTAVYMPRRPVMRRIMEAKGAACGCIGDQISWPIDALVPGDVYVADCFGWWERPIIGDNLATSMFAHSATEWRSTVRCATWRESRRSADFAATCVAASRLLLAHHHAHGAITPYRIGHARSCRRRGVGQTLGRHLCAAAPGEKVVKGAGSSALRDISVSCGSPRGANLPARSTLTEREIERDFSGWLEAHLDELPAARDDPGLSARGTW